MDQVTWEGDSLTMVNRGDPILTRVYESADLWLLKQVLPKKLVFSGKDVRFLNRECD